MATQPARPIDIGDYRKIKLWLNKGGVYEIRWADAAAHYATRRESCRTKVLAEAEAYLLAFCDAVRQHTQALAQPAVPTIEDLCSQWLLKYAEPQGKAQTGRRVLVPVRKLLGRHLPGQLRDVVLQDYAAQRGEVAGSTIRRELTALKTVLRWAVRKQLIPVTDMPVFDEEVVPPHGAPRNLFLDLTQEAFMWDQAMAWGARDHGRRDMNDTAYRVMVFVALGLETAARREAILDLTWDRVDLALGRIDFNKPGRRLTKKRRVTGLAISDRLMPVLRAAWLKAPKDASGQATGRVLGASEFFREGFVRFTTAIGMPWVTPHVLRHSWGSLAAMAGYPLYDIAKFMGDTIATVEKNYLHLTPDHLKTIANFKKTLRPGSAAVA